MTSTIRKILRNTYVIELSVATTIVLVIYHYASTVKNTEANASAITELKSDQSEDRKTINQNLEKLNDKVDSMGRDVSRMKGILEHWK